MVTKHLRKHTTRRENCRFWKARKSKNFQPQRAQKERKKNFEFVYKKKKKKFMSHCVVFLRFVCEKYSEIPSQFFANSLKSFDILFTFVHICSFPLLLSLLWSEKR